MPEKKELIRVHIFHDGTHPGWDVKVTDANTGKEFGHIKRLTIELNPDNFSDPLRAIIHFSRPLLDIMAEADITEVCPCCRRPVNLEEEASGE